MSPSTRTLNSRRLDRPPVVEAIIQINSRVNTAWEEARVTAAFKSRLPEYTRTDAVKAFTTTVEAAVDPTQSGKGQTSAPLLGQMQTSFDGLRMQTSDGKWVASFGREFFGLSWMAPYGDWEKLCHEAMRLWTVHCEIGGNESLSRIACRYINRLEVPIDGVKELKISDYFKGFGCPPGGFKFTGFLHSEMLCVPGLPYAINLIRAHQMPLAPDEGRPMILPLILDVEVFLDLSADLQEYDFETRLSELRDVKNEVFFNALTDEAISLCNNRNEVSP